MTDIITVTGNVASDPERRVTGSGIVVAGFRLATRQRRFDRASNAWVDGETNWFSVSAFRALGEHAYASLRRGDRVVVVGRLRLREWETAARKGWTAEIDADSLGHDLLWGTTTFQRDESRMPSSGEQGADRQAAADPPAEPAADLSEQWSAPLVTAGAGARGADEIPF